MTTTIHTPSGLAIELTCEAHGPTLSMVAVSATLPARRLAGALVGPLPLATPVSGATQYVRIGGQAVGLDATAAAQLLAARAAAAAAWQASAAGQDAALRAARATLADALAAAYARESVAREQAFGADTRVPSYGGAAVQAAEQALAAFDAAHPALAATLAAEAETARQALVRRAVEA